MARILVSTAAALALLGGSAFAQTVRQEQPSPTTIAPQAPGTVTPGTSPGAAPGTADGYRSYRSLQEGSFQGQVTGGMLAQDLIGKSIVDQEGDEIAEVADLVIEPDNTVRRVLIDVGGFLGIGSRTVAIGLDQLTPSQGDEDELVTTMTRRQIEGLPPFEMRGDRWHERG
jgi:hypothetical protein